MLTTITPYWGRPEALRPWLVSVLGSTQEGITHLVYFVGEVVPGWWKEATFDTNVIALEMPASARSIGYYHNLGARTARTQWIMKMDIDTVCNQEFFAVLLAQLSGAGPRAWFNIGMFMAVESWLLREGSVPLSLPSWNYFLAHRDSLSPSGGPVGTNFVCRRDDYLSLGGCDTRFRAWGWEDYHQIFMLAAHEAGVYPLAAPANISNVTSLCRDLSRIKARESFGLHPSLALVHHYHDRNSTPDYRAYSEANKRILLERITSWKPINT